MRLGKVLRFQNRKAVLSLDLFNILNDNTIARPCFGYNTQWLSPTDRRGAAPREGLGDVRLLTDGGAEAPPYT